MLVTTRGVVFLEGAAEQAAAGTVVGPANTPGETPDDADAADDTGDEDGQEQDDREAEDEGGEPDAVKAELAAYRRWARRNPRPRRRFRFTVVTKADAPDVNQEFVLFADPADGGGAYQKRHLPRILTVSGIGPAGRPTSRRPPTGSGT